jgi:hypothetical protein
MHCYHKILKPRDKNQEEEKNGGALFSRTFLSDSLREDCSLRPLARIVSRGKKTTSTVSSILLSCLIALNGRDDQIKTENCGRYHQTILISKI